jgi:hypothetical protein
MMIENHASNMPAKQLCGIETIDINLELILALADIDSTIKGLKNIGFSQHELNIANKSILIRESSRLIFTLKDQAWTYLYKPIKQWGATPTDQKYVELSVEAVQQLRQNHLINNKPTSNEAKLSLQIDSNVIYFGVSDTGDWITYSFFKSGTCLEWFMSQEDRGQGHSNIQTIDINNFNAYTLIYDSIVQNNAYIPYIHGGKVFTIGENELVKISDFSGLNDNDILRIDHVAE